MHETRSRGATLMPLVKYFARALALAYRLSCPVLTANPLALSSTPSPLLAAYLEQRATLLRLFARRTGDAALAEDVVQDLYLRLSALDPAYRVDNPLAFMFRTANNIYLNKLRALGSGRSRERAWHDVNHARAGEDTIDDAPSALDQVSSRQQLLHLLQSLAELPDKTQTIFRLNRFDGLSQQDVAQTLGISLSSVEKHLSAALKHLMNRQRQQKGGG